MTRSGRSVRRVARGPETGGIAAGFLSLLVKLAAGSDRLEQARRRRRG